MSPLGNDFSSLWHRPSLNPTGAKSSDSNLSQSKAYPQIPQLTLEDILFKAYPIPEDQFYHLSAVVENPKIIIFDSHDLSTNQYLFESIQQFIEGSGQKKAHDAPIYTQAYDFKIQDVVRYFNHKKKKNSDLSYPEEFLLNDLVKTGLISLNQRGHLQARTDAVLLGIYRHPSSEARYEMLDHELQHAQYFLNPDLRKKIQDISKTLPRQDRQLYRSAFRATGYKEADWLFETELQAYATTSYEGLDDILDLAQSCQITERQCRRFLKRADQMKTDSEFEQRKHQLETNLLEAKEPFLESVVPLDYSNHNTS